MTDAVLAWRCPQCLAVNAPARTACQACGVDIPEGGDDGRR